MLKHQRELADWLRTTYDAKSVHLEPGGKHPRLHFEVLGYPYSFLVPAGGSTGFDWHATRNAQAQIRAMVGQPPQQPKKQPRKLEDMMPDAIEKTVETIAAARAAREATTWQVKLACYQNVNASHMVWLLFTKELRAAFPGPFRIERLDAENWRITPGGPHRFSKYGNWYKLCYADSGVPLFGSSPAEAVEVDEGLLIYLPLTSRQPVKSLAGFEKAPPHPDSDADDKVTPKESPPDPRGPHLPREGMPLAPEPTPPKSIAGVATALVPSPITVGHLEGEMRDVLATVRRIEALVPYRFVRLESGKLQWRAPTIE